MTEQEALENFIVNNKEMILDSPILSVRVAWQAALEWARSEQEPVMVVHQGEEADEYGFCFLKNLPEGEHRLYRHPTPAPDVQELVEEIQYLLQVIDDSYGIAWSKDYGIQDWETISQLDDVKKAIAKWEGK